MLEACILTAIAFGAKTMFLTWSCEAFCSPQLEQWNYLPLYFDSEQNQAVIDKMTESFHSVYVWFKDNIIELEAIGSGSISRLIS